MTPTRVCWYRSRAAASRRTGRRRSTTSILELAEACDVPVRWCSCRVGCSSRLRRAVWYRGRLSTDRSRWIAGGRQSALLLLTAGGRRGHRFVQFSGGRLKRYSVRRRCRKSRCRQIAGRGETSWCAGAELPCVKVSGLTWPVAMRCKRSSPTDAAARSPAAMSESSVILRWAEAWPQTPA